MAALDAARKAAEVLKEVSEGVGIPWLKAGVGTVLIVLNMAKVRNSLRMETVR